MNWMKEIDDNKRIRDLNSIPKTHNSCAVTPRYCSMYIPWQWAQCQNKSITRQLAIGVRAFDIRLRRLKNGSINIPHAFQSSYYIESLIEEISDFLKNNPSEMVFLFFKREWNTRGEWNVSYIRDLWKIINKGPVIDKNIDLNEPIKNLRGKLIPIPEKNLYNEKCKGKLDGYSCISVNNSWDLTNMCSVNDSIKNFLIENNGDNRNKALEIQLNYLPLKGIVPPRIISFFTNLWFRIKIEEIKKWNDKPGFIGVDFVNKKICKKIYEMNLI
jgi:hypothetical protein